MKEKFCDNPKCFLNADMYKVEKEQREIEVVDKGTPPHGSIKHRRFFAFFDVDGIKKTYSICETCVGAVELFKYK